MGILKRNVPPKSGRASVSIIAKGNSLSGDITINGKTHIDGLIMGHLIAKDDISIGKHGRIKGRVRGTSIYVSGTLEGEIICDHLFIEPGGQVQAQVCCTDMKIDQGGIFVGERTLPEATLGAASLEVQAVEENEHQQDIFADLPERITLTDQR